MASRKELDMGMKCIKYMLCVSNLMFVIVGILLISIGYTVKAIYHNFDDFLEDHYYHPSSLAIVIGFFIFGIAFLGCVGALKESTFIVNTYAFFLTLVLILQISASIAAYAMRSNIYNTISRNMHDAMINYDREYNAFAWNSTQYNLQCCGIEKNTDWNDSLSYINNSYYELVPVNVNGSFGIIYVPLSCFRNETDRSYENVYPTGCLPRLSYIVSQCALLLGVGALCVAFIQVLGIIFASMLATSIRKVKTQRLVETEQRRRHFYNQMVKNSQPRKSPELYTPTNTDL
ncbi:CD63 antigen-like [Euwallacea similis]|uniref:CD63 antigen-like n=1 Tax=Euwallacea similis TaxID=1736056 RepID=UPI00344B69AB